MWHLRKAMNMAIELVVKMDPEIMGNIPCFNGTRVPVRTIKDYKDVGYSFEDFVEDFPSVGKGAASVAWKLF